MVRISLALEGVLRGKDIESSFVRIYASILLQRVCHSTIRNHHRRPRTRLYSILVLPSAIIIPVPPTWDRAVLVVMMSKVIQYGTPVRYRTSTGSYVHMSRNARVPRNVPVLTVPCTSRYVTQHGAALYDDVRVLYSTYTLHLYRAVY